MPRLPGLPLFLAAAGALALGAAAARAGDPSRDLDEVDSHVARDVGDAATGEPRDVGDALAEDPADPHVVDAGRPGSAGPRDPDESLESPKSLEEADRPPEWTPPACEDLALELGELPAADDASAWAVTLGKAEAQFEKSRTRLAAADADYTYARNRQKPRGDALKKIVAARDAARSEYAAARCRLPALVEKARRAGVPSDVLRDFPASIE